MELRIIKEFYVCVPMYHNSILYKEPARCNFGSIVYQSLQNYSTCFGRFLCPSSGVLTTVEARVAATTVVNTPDDGRRKRPKHVE